jgi:hypothetical protein
MAVLLTLARHTRAREAQMQLRADEILRIADEASNEWMEAETEDGANTPGYRPSSTSSGLRRRKRRRGAVSGVMTRQKHGLRGVEPQQASWLPSY